MDTFVGYCSVELADELSGVTFPMVVFYPTFTPEKTERLGPYNVNVAKDAEPREGVFPLILISHGSGGSNLVYRTLAHHLARNGFIVGMPEHPFNNRNNNTLEGTVENLINRPRHIHIAINWFYDSWNYARFLKPDSVAIIGHSMGGYTALALAGGVPTSFPNESSDGQTRQISIIPDFRVKALVLLAPAVPWFREERSLTGVNVPILMFFGERDEFSPYIAAQLIQERVIDKTKIRYRVVKNAGHYSFLSPFPESMTNVAFPPSQDPCGFNRENFHNELNAEVLDFLLRNT